MKPASVLRFLTSTRGRISRRDLALGMALPFIVIAGVVDALDSPPLTALFWALTAWPLFVATPWKRLHDMGRSGRWNLVFVAFYVIGFGFFLAEYASAEGGWAAFFDGEPAKTVSQDLTASGMGGFSTILIFLPIQLVWLYVIPGQRGPNRFGPPPRDKE